MNIIRVVIPKVALFPLYYKSESEHYIGDLVKVPFKNKTVTGIVWEINCLDSEKKLKNIYNEELFSAKVSREIIELIKKASDYYLAELGTIAKLVLPVDINEPPIKIFRQNINVNLELSKLTKDQQDTLEIIQKSQKPIVVKGITGSGKTEIYFHAILEEVKQGKQALILLPEILLSTQIISRFQNRFGFEPAIWNSTITKAQKKLILRGIISGDIKIVIGTRSALFLPYNNLGIIVVDEEHDPSYKQNEGILYNARDMAVLRATIEKCKILLVSATPSIESIYNTINGKYSISYLKNRFNDAYLPDVSIIDMKEEEIKLNNWISLKALKAIEENIRKKQQTLIFLNRRGYAPLMICKLCGYRVNCKLCSASMVVHKKSNRMECHHCGAISPILTKCLDCNEQDGLILCGPGIERIYEEVNYYFPSSRIQMISKEQNSKSEDVQQILRSMENGEIDIMIGTQVVTKGYHFPNLTLVIVVDADLSFIGGDFRASEKTFQLLHQVGGRAGRGDKKGNVILQTYYPKHSVIKALSEKKEEQFIKQELLSREQAGMPPFSKIALITITGKKQEATLQIAKNFVSLAPKSTAKIMGPTEAPMLKLSGRYRYKILILADRKFNLQAYLKFWKSITYVPSTYHIKFDIDPYSFS